MAIATPNYTLDIAQALRLKSSQVGAAIRLLDEGNSIPFIARYRKEMTGALDENQLRLVSDTYQAQKALFERKSDVLRLLGEHGAFTDATVEAQLAQAIQDASSLTEVDDIYRPYRPKRKTRASVARERGLAPLQEWLVHPSHRHLSEEVVVQYAQTFLGPEGIASVNDAMQGASDILAEAIADDASIRKWVRTHTFGHGSVRSVATNAEVESVYEAYYDFQSPMVKILPHQVLAINRGERETLLNVSIVVNDEALFPLLVQQALKILDGSQSECRSAIREHGFVPQFIAATVIDAYKRLLAPAIMRELRNDITAEAEEHAIHIFGANLRNLLLQPPVRGRVVLGVDPAYRTGCKLAVVDDTGKLQETSVIYPTPPQSKVEEATEHVLALLRNYQVTLIAIGNGTASRETEKFIADCVRIYRLGSDRTVEYAIVNEAGASVYSASPLAGEEFPALNASERSAVSIARRIQDPLAELVKIDPKSVGVGQYQHDVSQKRLDEQLTAVVESAVNHVGVDVNTASASLLSYVSGLNKTVAKNIVLFRDTKGRFTNRKGLAKVPRLGPKTLEQCAGFLRIVDGDEPLDATPIHPESYPAAEKLFARIGVDKHRFLRDASFRKTYIQKLRAQPIENLCAEVGVGAPTLYDMLDALERKGRDMREDIPAPMLRTDVLKLEDLKVGMVLTGTVRNVVDFGAFVDIGIKNDGLVHVSQLSDRFVKRPLDVVSVGDVVEVRVIQIDENKGRVGLSMKTNAIF